MFLILFEVNDFFSVTYHDILFSIRDCKGLVTNYREGGGYKTGVGGGGVE